MASNLAAGGGPPGPPGGNFHLPVFRVPLAAAKKQKVDSPQEDSSSSSSSFFSPKEADSKSSKKPRPADLKSNKKSPKRENSTAERENSYFGSFDESNFEYDLSLLSRGGGNGEPGPPGPGNRELGSGLAPPQTELRFQLLQHEAERMRNLVPVNEEFGYGGDLVPVRNASGEIFLGLDDGSNTSTTGAAAPLNDNTAGRGSNYSTSGKNYGKGDAENLVSSGKVNFVYSPKSSSNHFPKRHSLGADHDFPKSNTFRISAGPKRSSSTPNDFREETIKRTPSRRSSPSWLTTASHEFCSYSDLPIPSPHLIRGNDDVAQVVGENYGKKSGTGVSGIPPRGPTAASPQVWDQPLGSAINNRTTTSRNPEKIPAQGSLHDYNRELILAQRGILTQSVDLLQRDGINNTAMNSAQNFSNASGGTSRVLENKPRGASSQRWKNARRSHGNTSRSALGLLEEHSLPDTEEEDSDASSDDGKGKSLLLSLPTSKSKNSSWWQKLFLATKSTPATSSTSSKAINAKLSKYEEHRRRNARERWIRRNLLPPCMRRASNFALLLLSLFMLILSFFTFYFLFPLLQETWEEIFTFSEKERADRRLIQAYKKRLEDPFSKFPAAAEIPRSAGVRSILPFNDVAGCSKFGPFEFNSRRRPSSSNTRVALFGCVSECCSRSSRLFEEAASPNASRSISSCQSMNAQTRLAAAPAIVRRRDSASISAA